MSNNYEINQEVIKLICDEYKLKNKDLKSLINALKEQDLYLTEAAFVLKTEPLLIVVEQSLFDSAVIYEFPSFLVQMFDLKIGTKLTSKNIYGVSKKPAANAYNQYVESTLINDINPYILDFYFLDFKTDEKKYSSYHYEILQNKALFMLKMEGFYFNGITRKIGGTKDDFSW